MTQGLSPSAPELPVQHSVIDRLLDVLKLNFSGTIPIGFIQISPFQVGDGPSDAEYFVMGAGREPQIMDA